MVTPSRVEALRDPRGAKKGIRSRFENNGHPERGSDSATVDPNSPTFDPTVDTVSTEDVLRQKQAGFLIHRTPCVLVQICGSFADSPSRMH